MLLPVVALLYACSGAGGGGCGGCGGTTGGEVYRYPADGPVIQQGAQVHVTERGFDFIANNAAPIIGDLLGPGGLSFCLGEQDVTVATICGDSRCDDGSVGCQLAFDIRNLAIEPVTVPDGSDYLRVSLGLGVDEELDASIIGADCIAYIDSPADGIPITANIYFDVDAPPGERVSIAFPADELEFSLSSDYIDIDGDQWFDSILCEPVDLLAGSLLPTLESQIAGPIEAAIGPALCTSCEANPDCPGGSSCVDGLCTFDGTDTCVPLALGIETALDLGSLLSGFAPGLEAELGILFYLANYADAVGPDPNPYVGLDLAAQVGFTAEPNTCVPYQPAPTTARVPKSPSINAETGPGGIQFAAGIGLSQNAINLALWGVYNSGALCLKIGTDTIAQISTGTFSALLPSLGTLTDGENRPMFLQLRPQLAPTATLGAGTIEYADDGTPTIVDPLLTLNLNSLYIDFYGFVESRYVRLFTLDTDVAVPLGLDVNDAGQIIVVLGDLTNVITRIETLNGELLAPEDVASVASLLPTLIGALLPALGGDLIPPIDLPAIQGFQLVLTPGSITSVDSNTMLAIYADLALAAASGDALTMLPMPRVIETRAAVPTQSEIDAMLSRVRNQGAPLDIELLIPDVELDIETLTADLDADAFEYSYRIDGGFWSFWHRGDTVSIHDPVLALQGDHVIDVRVRPEGAIYGVSPHIAQSIVTVDYEGPRVALAREGLAATVTAFDAVTPTHELSMRYRVNNGEWSVATAYADQIDLAPWAGGNALLEVEVFDRAGQRGTETRAFNLEGLGTAPVEIPATSGAEPQAGCSAGRAQGNGMGLLSLVGLAMVWGMRRRRAVAAAAVATAAVALGACGNDKRNAVDITACDPACAEGTTCVDGVCVECTDGSDCPSGICTDGVCEEAPCSDENPCEAGFVCEDGTCVTDNSCAIDDDCPDGQVCIDGTCSTAPCTSADECPACEAPNVAACVDGTCLCEPPCAEGCAEGTACCPGSNSCVEVSFECAAEDCPPGTRLEATSDPTFDPTTCTSSGECQCVTLPPLDPGAIGRDLDLGVSPDGSQRVAAAYNSTYGDLMVGAIAGDGSIDWTYAQGAPTTGAITGDPAGPRGGIADRGPDVGIDPSVEIADDGTVYVTYGSKVTDEQGLYLAVGKPGGSGGWGWTVIPVELGTEFGRWSDLLLDAEGRPVIVYGVPAVRAEAGTWSGQVRIRTALVSEPATPEDLGPAVIVDDLASTLPCGGSCAGRRVCQLDIQTCVVPERASACDPECAADTQACVELADTTKVCADVAFPPAVTSLPEGNGLFADAEWIAGGLIGVAYYDRTAGNLRYATFDPVAGAVAAAPVIVDGETLVDGVATDTGDVGWFPDLATSGAGSLYITYFDATLGQLRAWDAAGATIAVVDDGLRCNEFVDGSCIELEVSLVGYDSTILVVDGSTSVLSQDATRADLVEIPLGDFGWDIPSTVAGDAEPYDGAFGFYTDAAIAAGGTFFATHRLNMQADPRVRDVVVTTIP